MKWWMWLTIAAVIMVGMATAVLTMIAEYIERKGKGDL